jgi:hypothetical protein
MPSARSQFDGGRQGSIWLQLLDSSSGSVHISLCEFNSTAEATAAVGTSAVASAKTSVRLPCAFERSHDDTLTAPFVGTMDDGYVSL